MAVVRGSLTNSCVHNRVTVSPESRPRDSPRLCSPREIRGCLLDRRFRFGGGEGKPRREKPAKAPVKPRR